jgi:two-component system, sensor histidine kinase
MQSMQDIDELWPLVRQHPRTQAEVARAFFRNVPTGAVVIYPAIAITAWVYHNRVDSVWLYSFLAALAIIQTVILLHWRVYQRQVQAREANGQWAWSVTQLKTTSVLSVAKAICISLLGWIVAHPNLGASPQVASVMVLIYLLGATVAHFIYRPAVISYPIVLLLPLGFLNALSGNPEQWAIAGFFAFYFLGAASYISGHSKQLQLSIYQRFQLDELARKLEGERERAQAALDAKARFFAATSHDVRQPLQAMSIMLDVLRAQGDDPQQRKRLIHDLDVNMDALRALFDQVLEVSRLQAGTVQLQPRHVSLNDLFERLQARFDMQAQRKGLRLHFSVSHQAVLADALALERMVANLLGNAIKHTPAGGTVWVGWRAQRQRIEVRDSGTGIDTQEQQRIFDEFYQVDKNSDHAQGLGLGLAIVKRLAVLGGQQVGVRSAPGQGSTFWLSMQAVDVAQIMGAEMTSTQPVLGGSRNVLYVENDLTLLRLTSSLLRMNDWTVTGFAEPEEALAWLRQGHECALLITDFRLSTRWDGAQLIAAMRALQGRQHLPAIVMTGDGAVAERANRANLTGNTEGAARTRLLHKPVKTAVLLQVMKECVETTASGADEDHAA